jgi:N-acetylglucosaminyldiphosphoundecaprenol N-acetyl-beta-D-mannosaminyltransferase
VPEHVKLLDRQIKLVLSKDLPGLVSQLADERAHAVFFCNVHMLMLAQEDKSLADSMDKADWVFADGIPIAWLQSRMSGEVASVIRGYEIMLAVCDHAASTGEKVGFMGSTPDVMDKLVENLSLRFTGLAVGYQYCPPFMPGELESTEAELRILVDSGVRWLFVGLGCPKQEKWIARHSHELERHTLGVGAAFD